MKKLVIFGSGDIAQIVRFYFEHDSEYNVVAFTRDTKYIASDIEDGLPLYPFETIEKKCPPDDYDMFVAIGYKSLNKLREKKYYEAKTKGYTMASYVSKYATRFISMDDIGDNCLILEDNTIQPFVKIGNNVVLWSGNHIGHHVCIGDHVFISSHVVISGGCYIGNNCFLGVNSTINDHIHIDDNTVVGSGALIAKDTIGGGVYKAMMTPQYKSSAKDSKFFGTNE